MTFDAFIAEAWKDHGDHPDAVATRLAGALEQIASAADIAAFARIVTHVYGEHLARWSEGVALLEAARGRHLPDGGAEPARALDRGVAALRYAGELDPGLAHLAADDRIAALAVASSALAAQCRWQRAIAAYQQALQLAAPGLPPGSPALRALAVAGNNLAAGLGEKPDRDALETRGMVAAAEGALTYWRLAGTWLEEERAEYRLAKSLLQAGDCQGAVTHARRCVEVCTANDAPPFERFFGHAALALAHSRAGDGPAHTTARRQALDQYALVAPDEKHWCKAELDELRG